MSHCPQRVMAWPGGVRSHYGHPDLWNRLWVMTRGGVSKSTRWPPLLLETALVPSAPPPMSKPNTLCIYLSGTAAIIVTSPLLWTSLCQLHLRMIQCIHAKRYLALE